MLRKLRVALAAIFFIAITLLFLDFTGTLHAWFGWMAKIQFLPALLALNVAVVAGLLLLTLVAGRVYCSVICPLGVMQDIIAWFGGRGKKRRFRFSYSPARNWWRYAIFAIFVCAAVAGIGSLFFLNPTELAAALPDSRLWLGSAGLVLIATVLPYIFYTKGLEGVESGKASIIANVEPVVAALTGVVFFHETLSIWTLLGVCCVLGGVILLAKGDDTCKESNSSTAST